MILSSAIGVLQKRHGLTIIWDVSSTIRNSTRRRSSTGLLPSEEEPSFAMSHRNLAIAYYNKEKDMEKALRSMKRALNLYRIFPVSSEYDQLCSKAGDSNEDRLDLLEARIDLAADRDALYVEYITLLNNTCQYDKALYCLGYPPVPSVGRGRRRKSAHIPIRTDSESSSSMKRKHYDEAISY